MSESHKTLKFQLTMELGLNSYMLTLKVTQINIITVATVLVLLPKITILSVLNNIYIFFFPLEKLYKMSTVYFYGIWKGNLPHLTLITMKCKFILSWAIGSFIHFKYIYSSMQRMFMSSLWELHNFLHFHHLILYFTYVIISTSNGKKIHTWDSKLLPRWKKLASQ
jgi:hypothetical protein